MSRLKTLGTYLLIAIGFYIFATAMIYIGLNASYKNITNKGNLSNQIKIDLAQSTKVNGRIYGKITSTNENNLEGKYIKVNIFDKKDRLVGTKYLKIEGTYVNQPKKFMVFFTAEYINSYTVEIIEDTEEVRQAVEESKNLYKDIFTDEELTGFGVIVLIFGLTLIP